MAEEYYEEFVEAKREWEEGRERICAVERLAQLLAQTVLDFAAVLTSQKKGRKPDSYKELAAFLGSMIGHKDFLIGLAGFRNVLVHMYVELGEELERQAFDEIEREMKHIIDKLRTLAQDDPCLDDVKKAIEKVAKEWSLRYVAVFGSLARNGCGNDVDLVVKFGKDVGLIELGRLILDLEDALGSKVDVVVADYDVDPIVAKTIVDEAVLLWGDSEEFRDDIVKMYKKYLDEVQLLERYKGNVRVFGRK